MGRVLWHELVKTFLKWRSYITFIVIAVVVPLVDIALKLQGNNLATGMTRGLARDFLLVGNIMNGYFVTQFLMASLWVHIPFLITLAAGDQLAGEATAGTFRLLLTRPVSRTRILFIKYLTTLLYTAALIAFLAVLSLGLGAALFGTGDLLVLGKSVGLIPAADAPGRFFLGFALATLSMWTVASLSFLFSSLVENAIGPIVGTMGVIIVCYIISNVPVDLFTTIRPYLFTTYLNVWQKALEVRIPWAEVRDHVLILSGFNVGFLLVTWYLFVRKDILS
jgi:ABC-2 type transport system permease protein